MDIPSHTGIIHETPITLDKKSTVTVTWTAHDTPGYDTFKLGIDLIHLLHSRYPLRNMEIIAELKKIPPVTRFICGSSLAVTGATIANIISPYSVMFAKELVLKGFEVQSFVPL